MYNIYDKNDIKTLIRNVLYCSYSNKLEQLPLMQTFRVLHSAESLAECIERLNEWESDGQLLTT